MYKFIFNVAMQFTIIPMWSTMSYDEKNKDFLDNVTCSVSRAHDIWSYTLKGLEIKIKIA